MKKRSIIVGYTIGVVTTLLIIMITLNITDYRILTEHRYEVLADYASKYAKVDKLKDDLLENYYLELDEETIFDGIFKGMFESTGDKYTKYMNEDEFTKYRESSSGNYVGVGILSDLSDGKLHVKRVFPDSPADKIGILAGDFIVSVDGFHIDDVGNEKLIDIMLGEENTEITLLVLRDNEELKFVFKRGKVEIPFVSSSKINDMGYIYIYKFGIGTAKEFKKHLSQLEKEHIKGLIIDLRDNPGGLVSESTKIADELMEKGIIVYTLNKYDKREEYNSDSGHINIPYVVLINENSASASEILAGAIKGSESAKLIGSQSFGKGIIQSVTDLKDGSGYKITYSEYFTPSGENIHGIGIKPDYIVEYLGIINGEKPDLTEDLQLIKAIEVLEKNIVLK